MPKKINPTSEVLDDGTLVLTHEEVPDEPPETEPLKPGDVGYDWSQHYDTDKLFTYTFPNGKVVALKAFGTIYSKTWLYKLRNAKSDAEVEFAAIDRASCDEARDVLMELDDDQGDPVDELFKAWVKDGTGRGDEGLTAGN